MNFKLLFNPKSKTHIVNALTMITAGAITQMPTLKEAIDPGWYPYMLAGLGLLNYILRNVTDTAITDK